MVLSLLTWASENRSVEGTGGSRAGSSSLAVERPQSFCQEHSMLSAQGNIHQGVLEALGSETSR